MIVDIGSPKWNNDPEFIINNVIHEIYHLGYEFYTLDTWGFEPKSKEEFLQKTLSIIQNEGMAVYVSYIAQTLEKEKGKEFLVESVKKDS